MKSIIGIGSNKGNRINNIHSACKMIEEHIGKILKTSDIYLNNSLDYNNNLISNQNEFLNCAIQLELKRDISSPEHLLFKLKEIESIIGRNIHKNRLGNIPLEREIDLDILYLDDIVLNTDKLIIPHPRIEERLFVLNPLEDIDELIFVNGRKISKIKENFTISNKYSIEKIIPTERKLIKLDSLKIVIEESRNLVEYKDDIVRRLLKIENEYGIDIIDINRSNYNSDIITLVEEEIEFISILLENIKRNKILSEKLISLKTKNINVLKHFIKEIDIINCDSNFIQNDDLFNIISNKNKPIIYTYTKSNTSISNINNNNIVEELNRDILNLLSKPIYKWNIILNLGIENFINRNEIYEILKNIKVIKKKINCPLLLTFNKNFLKIIGSDQYLYESIIFDSIKQGINIIGIDHDNNENLTKILKVEKLHNI